MKKPSAIAEALAKKYNVCFYIISTADDYYSSEIFTRVQDFNFCSRVIAYEDFVQHPAFNSEALFTVKATEEIVTVTDKKVVGVKTNNFLFDFDKFDLDQDEKYRLEVLAAFLKENKTAYAVLAGHTDDIGTDAYNMELSYKRVEMISSYLVENLQADKSRILEFWFGKLNPVADNATREGRMQNRRVEILVGGM